MKKWPSLRDDDDAHTLPLGERLEGRRQKLEDWRGASLEDRTAIAKDVYDFDALSSSSEEPDVGDLTDGEDYYEEMHTRLLPDESEYGAHLRRKFQRDRMRTKLKARGLL